MSKQIKYCVRVDSILSSFSELPYFCKNRIVIRQK